MTIMHRSAAPFWLNKELPPDVAYLKKDMFDLEWTTVTFQELLQRKIESQQWELYRKRLSEVPVTKPCFIWVFCNMQDFPFGGWYIYIRTLKKDYGISFRHEYSAAMIQKAMELFPCGIIPVKENFDAWAKAFSKKYPHQGFHRKKNQGLLLCRCKLSGSGKLLDLLPTAAH